MGRSCAECSRSGLLRGAGRQAERTVGPAPFGAEVPLQRPAGQQPVPKHRGGNVKPRAHGWEEQLCFRRETRCRPEGRAVQDLKEPQQWAPFANARLLFAPRFRTPILI